MASAATIFTPRSDKLEGSLQEVALHGFDQQCDEVKHSFWTVHEEFQKQSNIVIRAAQEGLRVPLPKDLLDL